MRPYRLRMWLILKILETMPRYLFYDDPDHKFQVIRDLPPYTEMTGPKDRGL